MKKYYIHINSEQQGPYDLDDLKWKGINKDTPIWYEGLQDWTTAGNAEELISLFQTVPETIITENDNSTEDIFEGKMFSDIFEEPVETPDTIPEQSKPVSSSDTNNKFVIILFAAILLLAIIDGSIAGYKKTHNKYDSESEKLMLQAQWIADSLKAAQLRENLKYTVGLREQDTVLNLLNNGTLFQQDSIIHKVLINPNYYYPTVLFTMSDVMYQMNMKNEASSWYYLAILRTQYDVNRSTDTNAHLIYEKLTSKYGKQVRIYSGKNLHLLKNTISSMLEYERNHEEDYDPRWINFYGKDSATIDSLTYNVQLSKSPSEWKDIKDRTLGKFNAKFDTLFSGLKKSVEGDTNR